MRGECKACGRVMEIKARGLCRSDYERQWLAGTLANFPSVNDGGIGSGSLVCICPEPDPTGRYGSCARCNRGILSVMLERIARRAS